MKLILLGAPGAGKGTQAAVLSQKWNVPTISTGNILREAIKNGTPVGLQAKAYVESGKLVPDGEYVASECVAILITVERTFGSCLINNLLHLRRHSGVYRRRRRQRVVDYLVVYLVFA